jgi:ribosomal protein S12 methylthiotransferase
VLVLYNPENEGHNEKQARRIDRRGGRPAGGKGVREINLIAQDMTSYGRDIGTSLENMLRASSESTTYKMDKDTLLLPVGTDGLTPAGLIADEEKILPYIDMPLQHIMTGFPGLMDRKPLPKG